jgi:hypothetical protein
MTDNILTSDLIRDDLRRYLTKEIELKNLFLHVDPAAWDKNLPWGDFVTQTKPYAYFIEHCNFLKKNPEFVTMVDYAILHVDKRRAGFFPALSPHLPDRFTSDEIKKAIKENLLMDNHKQTAFILSLKPHHLNKSVTDQSDKSTAQYFIDACDDFMKELTEDVGNQKSDAYYDIISNAITLKGQMREITYQHSKDKLSETLDKTDRLLAELVRLVEQKERAEHEKKREILQSLPRFKIKPKPR